MSAARAQAATARLAKVDPWLAGALLVTAASLAVAATFAIRENLVFGFADSASHVVIPRRVFDNAEPGLAQLGTHWGPLFHVLQLPLVWIDPLYRTGASAMLVSALASLVTVFYLYRLVILVEAGRPAALFAAAALALSPSFAYAGVVPMLPATIMATTTANVYYLTRWAITGSGTALLLAGLALSAATLTHFDTWILAPLELGIVAAVAHKRWRLHARTEATLILWLVAGGYGVLLFLVMNVMIFGDPLAFTQAFEGSGDVLGRSHRGLHALLDYPEAAWLNISPLFAVAGASGAGVFLWRWRNDPRYLIPLLLLYPIAWYSLQAATAGSLIVPGNHLGDWRNLRYGVTILPAPAFFIATGFKRPILIGGAALVILLSGVMMVEGGRVAAWEDARHDVPEAPTIKRAAEWLAMRTDESKTFIPVHDDSVDRFELMSGLSSGSFIDANDTAPWRRARRQAMTHPSTLTQSNVSWMAWVGDRRRAFVRQIVRRADMALCYTGEGVDGKVFIRIYRIGARCPAPS